MLAVIFEMEPTAARKQNYFDLAAALSVDLAEADGFISVERFESLSQPGKLLSLSFWRDEDAIFAWRNRENHRAAQNAGRDGIFAHYRLRVASVIRDYDMLERGEAPTDSLSYHDP